MALNADFAYVPLSNQPNVPVAPLPAPPPVDPLGLLVGNWAGNGFNAIWRPHNGGGSDRFLELNLTRETFTFEQIPGLIANRGLLQADIFMTGVRYLQHVYDVNAADAGLHVEPGVWLNVPPTTNPPEGLTVVRMASIPHGTTILAQGLAIPSTNGAPQIGPASLSPFAIGNPGAATKFPEEFLSVPTAFRSAQLAGITQNMVDNPNSVLTVALAGKNVVETTVLKVSSDPQAPVLGGGVENTAFLQGSPTAGPNAQAAIVTAIFWIEKLADESLQLQYTQTVLLNFNGLSWPHVSVATLHKV
jgi:hypothetical protein